MFIYWKIIFIVVFVVVLFGVLVNFYKGRMWLVNYMLKWCRQCEGFRLVCDLFMLLFLVMVVIGVGFEVLV